MTWQPTYSEVAEWGRPRVVVDGHDISFFRGVPIGWPDYQLIDPYGHGAASFNLPMVAEHEIPASGETNPDMPWLRTGGLVDIWQVLHGENVSCVWSGFVTRFANDNGRVSVECAGELVGRLANTDRQRRVVRRTLDIGELIGMSIYTTNYHYRVPEPLVVGRNMDNTGGAGQTNLDYVESMLPHAFNDDTDADRTIMPTAERRVYEWRDRDDTTVHATIFLGSQGIADDLSEDATEKPNRYYGQGIDPDGMRWSNTVYPNLGEEYVPDFPGTLSLGDEDADGDEDAPIFVMTSELAADPYLRNEDIGHTFTREVKEAVEELQRDAGLPVTGIVDLATWRAVWGDGDERQSFNQALVLPLAADPAVVPLLRAGNGTIVGVNPDFDRSVFRKDRSLDYGEGVTLQLARRHARRMLRRTLGGAVVGTITLDADVWAGDVTHADVTGGDAEPMSRLDLDAGMNVRIRNFKGNPKVHAVAVDVSGNAEAPPSVRLTVDQQARNASELEAMIHADRQAQRRPEARRHSLLRRSHFSLDALGIWDGGSGAGVIRKRPIPGGQWYLTTTPGCQEGSIGAVAMYCRDASARFAVRVFRNQITVDEIVAHLGNAPLEQWGDGTYTALTDPANDDWLYPEGQKYPNLVYAAGGYHQACGYSPRVEYNASDEETGAPLNGVFRETGNWPIACNPLLWVAVWADRDTNLRGRFYLQAESGSA